MGRLGRTLAMLAVGVVALAATAVGIRVHAAPKDRPNIVVILADDLGYADVSAYYKGRSTTPNIDRLGQGGVIFNQGYVAAPVCAPSRAGLLTGRNPQRFGFEYLPDGPARSLAEHLGLAVGETTIADRLRAAGYHTGMVGKWHLGMGDEFYPMNRGFDEFWGFLPGQTNYIRPDAPDAVNSQPGGSPEEIKGHLERPRANVEAANAIVTGKDRVRVDVGNGYLTEQLTDQAKAFIARNAGKKPFFLYLAYNAPHTPLQTTRKYYDRFPQITDERLRIYAGMISALDDGVGEVLDALDKAGVGKDTIVVFLSDNGCAGYNPGLCSDKPLAGSKLTEFEGGIRVPFMMRWPARIAAGQREDRPVSSLDLGPTFLAAAGAAQPTDKPFDGRPILSATSAGGLAVPQRPLFWRTLPIYAVRDGDWKYHRDYDGHEYLFNIRTDMGETTNLIDKEPKKAAELRALYADWNKDKAAPAWTGKLITFTFGGRTFKFTD